MTYLLGRTVPVHICKSTVIVVPHLLLCNYVTLTPTKVSAVFTLLTHSLSDKYRLLSDLCLCAEFDLRATCSQRGVDRFQMGHCGKERFGADVSYASG